MKQAQNEDNILEAPRVVLFNRTRLADALDPFACSQVAMEEQNLVVEIVYAREVGGFSQVRLREKILDDLCLTIVR